MYYGPRPWHNLGVELDHPATSEEAIIAAGLNWDVELSPLYTLVQSENIRVPNQYAVTRLDRNEILGVVGSVYKPLKNREAFSFFDSVVGEGQAIYHTAGSLRGGRTIWILAKLPQTTVVKGTDLVDQFILLCNSHDGSSPIRMMITPIRVVCQNTLNVALDKATKMKSLRHCPSNLNRFTDVREALGLVEVYYENLGELANHLASREFVKADIDEYLDTIGFEVEGSTQSKKAREEIMAIWEGETGTETIKSTRYTAWSAFNSVVEFVDYKRQTRVTEGTKSEKEARLVSQWFGSGATLKQSALDTALAMVA
jgi:phage/plasmid-like protein (TIGR03299 family)